MTREVDDIFRQLGTLSVGTIVQVLQRMGLYRCFMPGLHPMTGPKTMVGRARTLRTVPVREDIREERRARDRALDPHRRAIEEVSPGDIVVIAARGSRSAGVLGDLLAERIRAAGGRGVLTDGCVRDARGLAEVDLPVFAAGFHAATFQSGHMGEEVDVPISCAEVLVCPGDYIVGDEEGVVVVPRAKVGELLRHATAQDDLDGFLRIKIAQGATLAEVQPPTEAVLKEYERSRDE